MARTQVQAELIATNAISGTIIADNAITATHIATNAISGTLVQNGGIVTTMIAANNVTAAKIVTDAIQTRHIADDQVTQAKIAVNSVGISELAVTDGSNGQALITNGSGTLSFSTISSGLATNAAGSVTSSSAGDVLTLVSTDAGATLGPVLNLHRNSSSPADGDILGGIKFTGESAGSGAHTYGQIRMENNGVTDGQEQGKLIFEISMPDGDLAQAFHIGRTEIAVNEAGEDLNFRAESDNHPYMLYLDAGNNRVGINLPTSKVTAGDVPTHPFEAWDDDEVTRFGVANNAAYVQRYQDHATAPATLVFDKARGNVSSPTTSNNGDDLGRIIFRGYTSNGMYEAASIHAEVASSGIGSTSDIPGELYFKTTADGGTASERLRIKSYGSFRFFTDHDSNSKKAELHNGEGFYVYNGGGGGSNYGYGSEILLDGLSFNGTATHTIAISGNLPGYTNGQYNCLKTSLGDLHFVAGGTYTGYISSGTGFTDVSDEREKENIVTISNATTKLKQLRGVYHTWKDTENKGTDTQMGLIAQEVEAVVPEVVTTSNPTSLHTPASDTAGLKGVAYAKLVPLLIETIKELEARIATLEG